jgi:molybdopterin molybdotransferase
MAEPMLILEEATRRLLARAQPTGAEEVALGACLGRVLADPRITAAVDVPPFANSSMDGYAVRAAETPGELRLAGEIAAGAGRIPDLAPGTALRIMTGAPLPAGADAVVPIEEAEERDGVVRLSGAAVGACVRLAGSDTIAGTEIRLPGALTPAGVAVLASLGTASVAVRRAPRVAIVSTGDELVEPGRSLPPGSIYDANTPSLAAAVADAGGTAVTMPRTPDDESAIEAALRRAAVEADLVVTSGGVSVGRHDHVREVLERRGSLDFWRIAVQPGKPLAVGELDGVTVIGLPGNPVSALVTFELFVRPFIRRMLGLPGSGRLHVQARPETRIAKDPARRAFLRVAVRREAGETLARSAGGQGSAQLRPLAEANGLLIVPEGEPASDPGRSYETIITGYLA